VINIPEKIPFDAVDGLGIAIRSFTGPQVLLHIGLLHKVEDESAWVLNLRHFGDLRNEPPTNSYRWVQVELDEINRRALVALCRLLAKKLPSIPFGFTFNRNYINQAGEYITGEFGDGLTCATFVMAVFDTYHIPLLRMQEWPAASLQDQGWQAFQVQQVQLNRGPFVAEGVKRHIGAPRYKPEHVTAGTVSANRPLGFAQADRLGARIVRELLASYPA
jgi:hypothetical protein